MIDMRRARCQHHQPVEAERHPRGGRHLGERGEKVLIERVAFAVDAFLLRHFRGQPAALLHRIGELAEAVGKLDPADIELKPFYDARIVESAAGFEQGVYVEVAAPLSACPPGGTHN